MSSPTPLVSVIIPIYNVERYLGECLDSVIAQSYKNLEIILVDDGSTDSSLSVCRDYAARDPRIKILTKENGGLSSARNKGLEHAFGDYIMFVDSDDLIPRNSIEHLIGGIISNNSDMATGALAPFHDGYKLTEVVTEKPFTITTGTHGALNILYQNKSELSPSACGKLFHKNSFNNSRFTEGILYEDLDLIPLITAKCRAISSTDTVTYYYRTREDSILGVFNERRFDVLDVGEMLVEHFSGNPELREAASDRLMSAAFNMLMLMGRHGYDDESRKRQCRDIIRRQRFRSLVNPRVRLRNKAAVVLSYIFGIRFFSIPMVARRFLTR